MVHSSLVVSAILFTAAEGARIEAHKYGEATDGIWVQHGDAHTVCSKGKEKKVKSEEACRAKAAKAKSTFYSFSSHKGGRCKYSTKCKLRYGTLWDWTTYKLDDTTTTSEPATTTAEPATAAKAAAPLFATTATAAPVIESAEEPEAEVTSEDLVSEATAEEALELDEAQDLDDAEAEAETQEDEDEDEAEEDDAEEAEEVEDDEPTAVASTEPASITERKVEMYKLGAGYCPDGYVGGWDGLYLQEEECIQYCLNSSKCHAVSYCPQGEEACLWGGSCSRYEKPCPLDSLNTTGEVGSISRVFAKPAYQIVTFDDDYDVAAESKKNGERLVDFVRAQLAEWTEATEAEPHEEGAVEESGNFKVAMLSMLGSYAPLTKAHLNAFVLTRDILLKRGFDLVVGVMSMNPDGPVAAKLSRKGQLHVDFATRHALANCAFEDAGAGDWMFTEKGQTQHYWKLKNELKRSSEPVDIQLFFMNGADDVFAGRKYNQCGKEFHDGRKFIMVGRPGETDKVQEQLQKLGISGDDLDCLWVDNENGYSSSMLRSSAQNGDWDTVWEISDRCVAAFMNGPWYDRYTGQFTTTEAPEADDEDLEADDETEASFMETDPRAWSEESQ